MISSVIAEFKETQFLIILYVNLSSSRSSCKLYQLNCSIFSACKGLVINNKEAEKKFLSNVDSLTNDYMDFMIKNGENKKSFIEGTFLGDDLNFCNEIRSAIEISISESKKQE